MTRLRWRSSAFLVYLRNTIYSADAHSNAISVKLSDKDVQQASYRPMAPVERLVSSFSQPPAAAAYTSFNTMLSHSIWVTSLTDRSPTAPLLHCAPAPPIAALVRPWGGCFLRI